MIPQLPGAVLHDDHRMDKQDQEAQYPRVKGGDTQGARNRSSTVLP